MTFTEVIGGVTVADPFRWLEADEDPTVIAWQRAANETAVKELAASPNAAKAAAAVHATFEDVLAFTGPRRFGDTWFRTVPAEDGGAMVLRVGATATDQGRVLVDPRAHGPEAVIAFTHPSPDGSRAVIAISTGGQSAITVVDTTDGRVIRDLGSQAGMVFFSWAADASGFFHQLLAMTVDAEGVVVPEPQVWWQPLEGDPERIDLEFDHLYTWPLASPDGRWLILTADQTRPRPRWITRLGTSQWTRFLPDSTALLKGTFVGDEFWAITDDTSGWCRLVVIPLATPNVQATWRELIPATDEVKLVSVTRCGSYVALTTIERGTMHLRSLDLTGAQVHEIPLPGEGAFGLTAIGHLVSIDGTVSPDGDGCVFVHSTLTTGPTICRADLALGTLEVLIPSAVSLDDCVVTRGTATGPHGRVEYFVLSNASAPLDGSAPVVVTGYGGFNCPWIPCFSAMGAAWTRLGGVWVHTQLRGGGERDTAFWEAGRMQRKQGTFDDFFAVLEDLHERGIADPSRTGVVGASNGGLLVGATVTQRPELLRAAVAQVPLLDLMQCRKDPATASIVSADYGHPEDPTLAPAMHAYSPYHSVKSGTAYPALLCDAVAEDSTCPPWHSRKMVAAVQETSTSGHRTLLRVREGSGHNVMTTDRFIERDIEELTFLYDELSG